MDDIDVNDISGFKEYVFPSSARLFILDDDRCSQNRDEVDNF